MRSRRKREKNLEPEEMKMDMTPMIDVVFLLLIFFMVATKFKTPEGKLNAYLPKDKGMQSQQKTEIDEIRILLEMQKSDPVIYLNRQYLGPVSVQGGRDTWDNLDYRLAEMHSANPDWPVVIDSEDRVPYDCVVQALDLCHKNDFRDLSFAAPKPETWREGMRRAREALAAQGQ